MTRSVRFGVTLPQIKRTWAEARDAAILFEHLGFHSVWVCDHLYGVPMPNLPILEAWSELAAVAAGTEHVALRTRVTPAVFVCAHLYGVPLPNLPILEAWSELAAVAAVTEHVELGTLVTPPFFRNPAVLAKQIATIDHIAGGRVIAGLGSGWFASEYEAYGAPFPPVSERLRALDETCELMKRLWSQEEATYAGRH